MLASDANRTGWGGPVLRLPRSRIVVGVLGSALAIAIAVPLLDLGRLHAGLEAAPDEPGVLAAVCRHPPATLHL